MSHNFEVALIETLQEIASQLEDISFALENLNISNENSKEEIT